MARGDEEFVEFAQASSARLQRAAYLLTGDRPEQRAPRDVADDVTRRRWLIIYAETVDSFHLNANLTLVLGRTTTGYINDFSTEIVSSDAGHSRMAEGFHAVQAGTVIGGRTTPTFGYYSGDPARITARDDATGATVRAH
jgi:hypothetical protein